MFPKIEVELMGFHAAAQPHIYEIMKHCPTLPITVNFNGGVKCVIQNIDAPPNPAPPQCPECSPLPSLKSTAARCIFLSLTRSEARINEDLRTASPFLSAPQVFPASPGPPGVRLRGVFLFKAATMTRRPIEDRFWAKVDKGSPNECWPWTGGTNRPNGYGKTSVVVAAKRRAEYAHRVSWELANGRPVPEKLCVLHSCDNPPCCNPAHLFLGTHKDNAADKVAKNRQQRTRGELSGTSKLTEPEARAILERCRTTNQSKRSIAKEFNIGLSAVIGIARGSKWPHVFAANATMEKDKAHGT